MPPTFDSYSDNYQDTVQRSISFSHQDAGFFTEYKAKYLLKYLEDRGETLSKLHILDVGCGIGNTDEWLIPQVGQMTGIDVSSKEIEQAARRFPTAHYEAYDGKKFPLADNSCDVSFAICVVHHVPPAQWNEFMAEMRRVTKPGGYVVIFEHNPWNPLTRLAVDRCDFDEEAVLVTNPHLQKIFRTVGLDRIFSPYILFFPWRGKLFRAIERLIGWLPLGAQYVTIGRK